MKKFYTAGLILFFSLNASCAKGPTEQLDEAKNLSLKVDQSNFSENDLVAQNRKLVTSFYDAMGRRDFETMNAVYSNNATFSDPVFMGLNNGKVRSMWKMLMTNAQNWSHEYEVLEVTATSASVKWIGRYDFSKTGRPVENHVMSYMVFENDKVVAHVDSFDFWDWTKMALGTSGYMLGWSSFMQNKVMEQAISNL